MENESTTETRLIPVLSTELTQSTIDEFAPNLQELEENIQSDIAKLRNYAERKNYPSFDDHFYLCFLRVAKYDLKKALDKFKHYCHMRRDKLADFYEEHMDADMIRKVLENNMVGVLPYRDEDGNAIVYTRGDAWSADICDFGYFVITAYLVFNTLAAVPLTSLTGIRYIADVSVNSYADYYMFQKVIVTHHSFVKAIPARIKNIDVVKDIALCRQLYWLVKPILPKKITKRVMFHGFDEESLHKSIDPDILPEEFGGNMGPLNNEFCIDKVLEQYEIFREEQIHFKNARQK